MAASDYYPISREEMEAFMAEHGFVELDRPTYRGRPQQERWFALALSDRQRLVVYSTLDAGAANVRGTGTSGKRESIRVIGQYFSGDKWYPAKSDEERAKGKKGSTFVRRTQRWDVNLLKALAKREEIVGTPGVSTPTPARKRMPDSVAQAANALLDSASHLPADNPVRDRVQAAREQLKDVWRDMEESELLDALAGMQRQVDDALRQAAPKTASGNLIDVEHDGRTHTVPVPASPDELYDEMDDGQRVLLGIAIGTFYRNWQTAAGDRDPFVTVLAQFHDGVARYGSLRPRQSDWLLEALGKALRQEWVRDKLLGVDSRDAPEPPRPPQPPAPPERDRPPTPTPPRDVSVGEMGDCPSEVPSKYKLGKMSDAEVMHLARCMQERNPSGWDEPLEMGRHIGDPPRKYVRSFGDDLDRYGSLHPNKRSRLVSIVNRFGYVLKEPAPAPVAPTQDDLRPLREDADLRSSLKAAKDRLGWSGPLIKEFAAGLGISGSAAQWTVSDGRKMLQGFLDQLGDDAGTVSDPTPPPPERRVETRKAVAVDPEAAAWASGPLLTPFGATDEQTAIITHPAGPLLVDAIAGSGKTSTVMRRLLALWRSGQDMSRVLCTTFTNAAVADMGYKWNAYAKAYDAPPWRKGPGGPGPQITTIHALGNRLLRRIGLKLIPDGFDDKRKPDESVLQDARKKGRKAVEKALNDAKYPLGPGLYNKRLKGRLWPGKEDIVDAIEYYTQTQPGTPDDVLDPLINQQERQRYGASPGAAVTGVKVDVMALQTDVNRELERLGRISFAGMQTMALHMLDTDPAIAAKVGGMFDHIVVDEAQDVSPLQLALVFRVAQVGSADAPNILLVGDSEGQSIYSFQGGRPELIQAFGRLAERRELTTNFRSVANVVSAAARLSGRDEAPLEGTPDGPKITTKLFGSVAAEAEGVVQGMIDAHAAGVPWKDMAILYRLKRFSALTQLYLWQSEVPHIVEKGEVFWTSRAPMLAMSYIKFMLKPRLKSFKAIMQTPFRKFGKGYVQAADGVFDAVGRTPDGVWPLLDEDLWPAEQWTGLEGLTEDLEDLSSVMDDAAQAIVTIANFSNARTGETLREKAPSGETTDDWTEAWPMLIAAAEAHGGTAAEFLTMVDAAVDAAIEMKTMLKDTPPHLREQRIEKKFGPEGAVTLTTAHSSKGREWPHVYIVGFQGGIFPLARSIKERRGEGEAEERRIAYVAITRAKETLLLSASGDSEQDAHSPYHGPILDIGEIGPAEVSPWLDAYTEWVSAGAPSGQAPFVIRPKEAD